MITVRGIAPPQPRPTSGERLVRSCLLALTLACAVACPSRADTNRALGGLGGIDNGTLVGGDGTGAAQITINAIDLQVVKQARDLAGSVIATGGNVAGGQVVFFVLYVDNPTSVTADDLQLTDALTESAFAYVPNSLEAATLASGSSDAALWAAAWTPLSDGSGGADIASAIDTGGAAGPDRVTVGATPLQPNQSLTVPAATRRAIRFRVRVN